MTEWKNILFKEIENRKLYLDLFVPEDVPAPPIIMWVHGGGWNELNRTWSLIMPMLERGYAVASVDYCCYTKSGHEIGRNYTLK